MCEPSTFETGLEKLSVIGVLELIVWPDAGWATAVAFVPAGNQFTAEVLDVSHF